MNEAQQQFMAHEARAVDGQTQAEKLRDYLLARPNEKISLAILAQVITPTGIGAAVHSRIHDCRIKFGMTIKNSTKEKKHGTQSWYTYEPASDVSQN